MSLVTTIMTKLIKFDVADESNTKTFEGFKAIFTAHANARGYGPIVKGEEAIPEKSNSGTNDALAEIYGKNLQGYSDLILAVMDNDEAFTIVSDAKDSNYPDGNVFVALTSLESRFKKIKRLKRKNSRTSGRKKAIEEGWKSVEAP